MTDPLRLDGAPLTFDEVVDVARGARPVTLGDAGRTAMVASRAVVDAVAEGTTPIYGINTGFGSLARHRISPEGIRDVQRNLIRSHAAGVGAPLPEDAVRAMMLLQAASLARGRSGARPAVVDAITRLLDAGVTPWVPSRGSVGASGDLAPLAHATLVLIGEGFVLTGAGRRPAAEVLAEKGIEPVTLSAKEGLALINGTHMMTAMAALALADLRRILDAATVGTAMAIDACRGTDATLDPRIHAARGQPGQERVARRLRTLLAGSRILAAHREDDPRVQDPYCLRAAPQVLGAALDAVEHVRAVVGRELGAVTDNPLVFADEGDVVSGGNFHGMPIAIALDLLSIALAHVAGIAERRVFWLLQAADPQNPLPAYLAFKPGLHSGLMIAQYTAAACCNEIQTLATPASVANISTAAGIEDYNSMGATAAHQVRAAVDLTRSVIAIELLVMAEGTERQRPHRTSDMLEAAVATIRTVVPPLIEDRSPSPDIEAIERLIDQGALD